MARKKKGGPRKKSRRRARGEGSVYQRESDNRWAATLVVGYKEDGRPKSKVFYGDTQEEAVRKRDEFRAKLTLGHVQAEPAPKQTVGQYLDRWFKELSVKQTTRRRYEQLIDYRIKPHLGGVPMEKLCERPGGVQIIKGWLAWLKERDADPREDKEGGGDGQAVAAKKRKRGGADGRPRKKVSERGREMAFSVLRKALNDAEQEDTIPYNPIRKVKSGRPRPAKPQSA